MCGTPPAKRVAHAGADACCGSGRRPRLPLDTKTIRCTRPVSLLLPLCPLVTVVRLAPRAMRYASSRLPASAGPFFFFFDRHRAPDTEVAPNPTLPPSPYLRDPNSAIAGNSLRRGEARAETAEVHLSTLLPKYVPISEHVSPSKRRVLVPFTRVQCYRHLLSRLAGPSAAYLVASYPVPVRLLIHPLNSPAPRRRWLPASYAVNS